MASPGLQPTAADANLLLFPPSGMKTESKGNPTHVRTPAGKEMAVFGEDLAVGSRRCKVLKINNLIIAAGLAVIATSLTLAASIELPLGGLWHLTLFPMGIGVLILILGVGLLAIVALRRAAAGRARDDGTTGG